MKIVFDSLTIVYSKPKNILLGIFIFILFALGYMWLLVQTSGWNDLWGMNNNFYNFLQILTSFLSAFLTAIAFNMLIYIFTNLRKRSSLNSVQTFFAILFSAATTGCYVCGTVLLPSIGIVASLTAMPLGGLEVKFLSILLLIYSIYEYSRQILGICKVHKDRLVEIKDGKLLLTPSKDAFMRYKPLYITIVFVLLILLAPVISSIFQVDFANHSVEAGQYSCITE